MDKFILAAEGTIEDAVDLNDLIERVEILETEVLTQADVLFDLAEAVVKIQDILTNANLD